MDYRIISIGALSHHELWPPSASPRTAHATTVLVRSGDRVILVDPGLPPQVVAARLDERAGLAPDAVTDVFLTSFRPSHRRGLAAFESARWLIAERERETVGTHLIEMARADPDPSTQAVLEQEIALLQRCQTAPDQLAAHVDLFPLPGFTPGTCGLLLCHVNSTTLVAGDAVATVEHLERGRVLRGAYDADTALASLAEAVEIADVLIPGHDNIVPNPTRRQF